MSCINVYVYSDKDCTAQSKQRLFDFQQAEQMTITGGSNKVNYSSKCVEVTLHNRRPYFDLQSIQKNNIINSKYGGNLAKNGFIYRN